MQNQTPANIGPKRPELTPSEIAFLGNYPFGSSNGIRSKG